MSRRKIIYDEVMSIVNTMKGNLSKEDYQLLCEDLADEFAARYEAVTEELEQEKKK